MFRRWQRRIHREMRARGAPERGEDLIETAGFRRDFPRLGEHIRFMAFRSQPARFQIGFYRLINVACPALIAAVPMDFIRARLRDNFV